MMKVLLLGGSGNLGKHLSLKMSERNIEFHSPTSQQCNLKKLHEIHFRNVDIVIHSAGFVNTIEAENNPDKCIDTNVIGTNNVVRICRKLNKRLVYISSEYVFSGKDSPYTNQSGVDPVNVYGMTKACGELLVKTLTNYAIIRAPFIRDVVFNHPKAFSNQYTSRQYVHQITDNILDISLSDEIGIKHVVGKYQSVLDLAKETREDVEGIEVPENLKTVLPLELELS